ncbi:MAG: hypothetical protein RMM30_11620 [Armatimonadota bacterium]|nr:hypothetical protein [Armatimonadota bacterium]MDW8157219.1 hypothetical protein [Armatimonadota bacterium]
MKEAFVLATALALVAGGPRGHDATTPVEVLRKAAEAPLRTDYEAVQVLTVPRAEGAETVRVVVWHRRPHSYRMEFLAPRRLAGRLLVDDGQFSWHYEPSLHLLIRGPSLALGVPPLAGAVARGAAVRLLGMDVVAGRPAYLVAVLPASGGPTRRLWVDRATGLVLKSEAWDSERGVYLTNTVIRVGFGTVPEELFRVPRYRGARTVELSGLPLKPDRLSQLARAAGFPVFAPSEVPEGFRYRGGGVAAFGGSRAVLLQYADGVTIVSLFQAPADRAASPPGGVAFRVGPVLARSYAAGLYRVLVWERRGVRFGAVGDAPVAVLRQFVVATDPDPSVEARRVAEVARKLGVPADRVADLRDQGLGFAQARAALEGHGWEAAGAPNRSTETWSLAEELERFVRLVRRSTVRRP